LNKNIPTAKINSIFLVMILIAGTFAAVYPSFIIGIQAQSEYEYENGYGYEENNDNSYNSAEYSPPSSDYPSTGYESDRYNTPEYSSPSSYEYPQSDYESNQKNNYHNYPPSAEDLRSADIVVPNDFDTIQEAIESADEGDVIKVLPGTYIEQITISKNITIIGSGAKSTIIEAPPLEELQPSVIGLPYIVEINNGAYVTIKGFTIQGLQGTDCDILIGVNVIQDGTIDLKHVIIKGCTVVSVGVGFDGIGHATLTKTFITDYRENGVLAFGNDTTLTMSDNKVLGSAPDALGIIGIVFVAGVTGTITNNDVSENICDIPNTCGPNWFNQTQAFGIVAENAGEGSVIANNHVTNNDAGVGVFEASGCCIIDYNKLEDNRFFGIVIGDSEHIVSDTKIFGGQVGAAAAATIANTTAILDQVKIVGAEIPIQALSTGNLTAAVNVLSPSFFQP
jgi:Right handed beta helix region